MGEKELLTLTTHHPHLPTPPLGDLPFELHRLLESSHQSTSQSPKMAHEYMTSQYGAPHYQDPHAVGLGIQHVSLATWNILNCELTIHSTISNIPASNTIKDTDRTLGLL